MREKLTKSFALIVGVLSMSFAIGYLIFAWQEPTSPPPGGNVPAPLNVGPQGQAKEGGLILNTGGATTGLIVDKGDVGIGTTTPNAKLDIQGGDLKIGTTTIKSGAISTGLNAEKVGGYTATELLSGGMGIFGNGRDGDHTVSGDTWWSINDIYYFNNLTINSGKSLHGSSNVLFIVVKNTLTVNGTLDASGENGGGRYYNHGMIGGAGGGGGCWSSGCSDEGCRGGNGGIYGGAGGNGDCGSGGSNSTPLRNYFLRKPLFSPSLPGFIYEEMLNNLEKYVGGDGAGGQGWEGGGGWGWPGGGRRGKTIVIFAKNIIINSGGSIKADGGNGAAPGFAGQCGGGGGGFIFIVTENLQNNGLISAKGGDAGGGDSGQGGGGGGGYILIHRKTESGSGNITVSGGDGIGGGGNGNSGTIQKFSF